jgi:hypothetical protein
MESADEVNVFERIVAASDKRHLGLRAELVSRECPWCTLVVSGPRTAVAYQCQRAWTHDFKANLENGRFG